MTVELRPLGVRCNIACTYCYQNPQREAGNLGARYDMEAMKAGIEDEGGPFSLFGGEPLLVPIEDLEELLSWGKSRWNSNGIQTNGTLITDAHVDLFQRMNVSVGISVDGPHELNRARWAGSPERTREATEATHLAIQKLISSGRPPSLIVTLHKANAAAGKLPVLADWFRDLDKRGIVSARLHILEVEKDSIGSEYALSDAENIAAFRYLAELEHELQTLRFDVFTDMRRMLSGQDRHVTCVWRACDSYTTSAVRGVEGMGQRSNCGRTNKEGIDFVKSSAPGFLRYISLYQTPQEFGGCQGCRFFLMCKGQCPGTSIDGNMRNRTEHCRVWKTLLRQLEEEMMDGGQLPLSANGPLRISVEQQMIDAWMAGENPSIMELLDHFSSHGVGSPFPRGRTSTGHGDHTDASRGARRAAALTGHGDHTDPMRGERGTQNVRDLTGHGDIPHGDSHGDHTDTG